METINNETLQKISLLPKPFGLLFFNLIELGLRVGEVCTIKGNSFYMDVDGPKLKVYSNKTKTERCIPIPYDLYDVMTKHISKYNIGPHDYIFSDSNGKEESYK